MIYVKDDRNPHWYERETGNPCHLIPKKNGDGMKAPNKNDAKELGLVPSVTTILGIIAKPALEIWKIKKAITACIEHPQVESELDQDYVNRIVELARQEGKDAADKGSAIHEALSEWITDGVLTHDYTRHIEAFNAWNDAYVDTVESEKPFATNTYGGTIDLCGNLKDGKFFVADFKSQVKKNGKFVYRPDFILQLAGYGFALFAEEFKAFSILFDRDSGEMEVYEYTWDEICEAWVQFQNALGLWCYYKGISND